MAHMNAPHNGGAAAAPPPVAAEGVANAAAVPGPAAGPGPPLAGQLPAGAVGAQAAPPLVAHAAAMPAAAAAPVVQQQQPQPGADNGHDGQNPPPPPFWPEPQARWLSQSLTVRLLQRWTTAELENFLLSMWEEMLQVHSPTACVTSPQSANLLVALIFSQNVQRRCCRSSCCACHTRS